MKKLKISVEGRSFDVTVELVGPHPPEPVPSYEPVVPPAPMAPSSPASSGPGIVPCPLSGRIVSIDVAVGTPVVAGQQLAIVEAMKMNTIVAAPQDGTVTCIFTEPGEGIEEGDGILEIS